jgi:hypothetical protein
MVNQCFWVEKHWLNPNPWSIVRQAQKVPPSFWLEPRNPTLEGGFGWVGHLYEHHTGSSAELL